MSFHVLAVSGSLRAGSSNTGLVRMAQRLAPTDLVIADPYPIADLPYYDGDLDTPEALPEVCARWRADISTADALLFAAPEYNYGPSAVMKNAFDWASRPFGAHPLIGKSFTVMTSAGGGGGDKVQAWITTIPAMLGAVVLNEPVIAIKKGATLIAADGTTTDPEIEELVAARLANLLAHLRNP